jgi:hypothetical protein
MVVNNMTKSKLAVNLGCYPPRNDSAYEAMIAKIVGFRDKTKKKMTKQNAEARELKKRALAVRADRRNEYVEKSRAYTLGDEFIVYTHPKKSSIIYKLKTIIMKEEIEVVMKNKHIILPHRKTHYNNDDWIEFYYAFVGFTDATHFTIITDAGIFKVRKSFIINHLSTRSVSRGYGTPCMISFTALKTHKAWEEFERNRPNQYGDYQCG